MNTCNKVYLKHLLLQQSNETEPPMITPGMKEICVPRNREILTANKYISLL